MLRVTVLAITLTVVLTDGDNKKCGRLFHPKSMHCCKDGMHPAPPDMDKEDLKECFKIPRDQHSCDISTCIAKKRGYAFENGTVDMDAWEKMIDDDFKSKPSLMEAIKEKCIKGDVSKYGAPETCLLIKLKMCTHRAAILDCKEWDDVGPCAGIKDLVRECAKMED